MRVDLYQDLYQTEEDHWWHRAKRQFVSLFIHKYATKKTSSILDIGCGTGKNMEEFASLGNVWGVDISDDALHFCKKRNLIQVKKGEAEKLPFGEKTFSTICILDVLEHVDDKKSFSEIRRVLVDGGSVVITVPAFSWLWSKWDEILHHKRRYTKEQLSHILKESGFKVIRSTYIHSFLIFPVIVVRGLKGLQKKEYSSDFQVNNRSINAIFMFLSKLEQFWVTYYDMPFGTSILCIAQKVKTE